MKQFMSEFKQFIARGNVMDMAVGVIIGGAFKAIVDSLVADILSPLLGLVTGSAFAEMSITVFNAEIRYGAFIMAIINFLLMAFVLFMIIKTLNRFHKKPKEEPAAPTTKICPYCKSEIPVEATRCPHCTSQLQ